MQEFVYFVNVVSKLDLVVEIRRLGKNTWGVSKGFVVCLLSMVPLMKHKFISKNLIVPSLRTIFLSNQKFTRCNYKLWLIVKRNFWMFLLDYLVPWMMFKFYTFLTCMERRWMETCFISIEVKRESNIIWLLTRATFYYHGWWFHTNKLKAFNILSLKHYIINIYGEVKMLWKIHLAFWKKTSKNYF